MPADAELFNRWNLRRKSASHARQAPPDKAAQTTAFGAARRPPHAADCAR
jgi:hypothetical protein